MSSGLLRFLLDELVPFPGRMNVTLRCLLGSAIVIVLSMTLQVPYLALSLIVTFYVTQSNVVITKVTGVLFFVGATLAVSSAILLLKFTFDYPLLRIVFASLVFFGCVYAMRVFQFGIIFFLAALIVIYVQSFVDVTENAEGIVRATLWVWAAVTYPIALALIFNGLMLPTEPRAQLRALMVRLIGSVLDRLKALQSGSLDGGLSAGRIESGIVGLQKLLRYSSMRGNVSAATHARDLATVTAVSNLYRATMDASPAFRTSGEVAAKFEALWQVCDALRTAIESEQPFTASMVTALSRNVGPQGSSPYPWPIPEVERTLVLLAAFDVVERQSLQPSPKQPVLASDAWTNPVYAQFSLKTLLAVLLCYVFYNAARWQGVHTVMLTCLVVAQPGLGASGRRSLLRFCGAVIGSLLALFEVAFVLPNIDGIAALLVAVMPVLFLGAWISAGSERVSYAGVQIMFTFSLAFLEQFAPTFDLTEIRDRMAGIFIGVCVATFIQMTLWPEGEAVALRRNLSRSLLSIGKLLTAGIPSRSDVSASWAMLANCEGILLRVALEPTWREGEEEVISLNANSVLAAGRQLLLASDAFMTLLTLHESDMPAQVAVDAHRFSGDANAALLRYAQELDEPRAMALTPSQIRPELQENDVGNGLAAVGITEQDLRFQMLRMRQAMASLPQWTERTPTRVLEFKKGGSNE